MANHNLDANAAQNSPGPYGSPQETIGGIQVPDFGTQIGTGAFVSARYPETIESGQDRVVITQFEYKRSGVIQTESDIEAKKRSLGYVILPMPNDLSESNSVGWGEDTLSNAAALLMGPAGEAAKAIAGTNIGEFTDAVGKAMSAFESRGLDSRVKQYLTARAAASLVGKLGININPEAYISRATTAAVNPNLELLFNGPKLRQFSLSYKMVARSQKEATQIRTILRFFKKGMSPKRSSEEANSFFLGAPNIFKVDFKSGNSKDPLKSIGQFKNCALVSFSANYTPDGFYAAYDDSAAGGSQPIAVVMQMGFTELTPVFNDEYDNTTDSVGPNNFKYERPTLSDNSPTPPTGEPNIPGGTRAGTNRTPPGGGSSTKSETIGTNPGGISRPVGGR